MYSDEAANTPFCEVQPGTKFHTGALDRGLRAQASAKDTANAVAGGPGVRPEA